MLQCSCFSLKTFCTALGTSQGPAGQVENFKTVDHILEEQSSCKDKQTGDALSRLGDTPTITIRHLIPGGLGGIKERMAAMGHSVVNVSCTRSSSRDSTWNSESSSEVDSNVASEWTPQIDSAHRPVAGKVCGHPTNLDVDEPILPEVAHGSSKDNYSLLTCPDDAPILYKSFLFAIAARYCLRCGGTFESRKAFDDHCYEVPPCSCCVSRSLCVVLASRSRIGMCLVFCHVCARSSSFFKIYSSACELVSYLLLSLTPTPFSCCSFCCC